ncbi:MAG: TOBE-like domain-containing protein [Actinomycetota bacterium]|nr:TOBE-like domain-containing protein [Actinomycetota bacterium]
MGFVGPAHRLGDAWVRPHDVEVRHEPNGRTIEALIDRIVHLGFEVRVELTLADGEKFSVQLTREQVDELELTEGQIVFVRPRTVKEFASDGSPAPSTDREEPAPA